MVIIWKMNILVSQHIEAYPYPTTIQDMCVPIPLGSYQNYPGFCQKRKFVSGVHWLVHKKTKTIVATGKESSGDSMKNWKRQSEIFGTGQDP